MWIIPKNYQPSLAFAADTLESSEDLTLPGLNIESSLMWRSKPTRLQTWSLRWKRENWMRHLFGRILKPSQRTYFEAQLTLSLAATLASRSARQVSEQGQTIPDIFGQLFGDIHKQLDLLGSSLKMSKATSRLDFPASSAIWKKMVIEQRGEYSQRAKLARLTKENESTSWATPNTMDYLPQRSEEAMKRLIRSGGRKNRSRPGNLREQVNPTMVQAVNEARAEANGCTVEELDPPAVTLEPQTWPTPRASEYKDCEPVGSKSQIHMDKRSYLCAKVEEESKPTGLLNPDWTEWLMGIPIGWTELGCWGTE